MSQPKLKQIIEGAVLAADRPLSIDQLSQLFGKQPPERSDIKAALDEIEQDCEDRGFELKRVASGYRFQVRHELSEWISRLWEEKPARYSRALLETLALIAYRQPITRGDIEEIRGVSVSTNIMRSLMEREWIRVVGHRDVPGRPAIYATTKIFLDYFNLESLEELPPLAEIKDLGKVNEELDLVDETVEILTLDLDVEGDTDMAETPEDTMDEQQSVLTDDKLFDEDLKDVSERVDRIQENIKTFVRQEFGEEEDEVEAVEGDSDAELTPESEQVKAGSADEEIRQDSTKE
ncbi:MAG: SMC-Scp complex subunit ScpB [Gammaproteobacteria bacterium]|nr:SMC-Scp complex subunit ScpB [Gammaproteobacteria bacterium]